MNSSFLKTFRTFPVRPLLVGVLLLPGWTAAQSVDASSPPNSEDEIITLTPFEVQADQDVGYMGLNAASGSRLSTQLRDTPASVSVFTAEFIQDIGATSIEDISAYAVNTEAEVGFVSALPNGNSLIGPASSITSRGLPTSGGSASGRTVNFFSYAFEVDTYNTDRVEFSRGPNSILFGIGQAGGSFNSMSRTADTTKRILGTTLRFGSHNARRATIDLNVPLIADKLAIRVDAVTDHEDGWRPWEHYHDDRVYVAVRYKPTARTTIDFQSETVNFDMLRPRPYLGPDHITDWLAAGRPTSDKKFTSNTPNAQGLRRISPQPWWVYIEGEDPSVVHNFSGMGRTANPQNTTTQIPMLQDFSLVPRDAVLAGPGPGNNADFENHTLLVRQEFTSNFFAEIAATRQIYTSDQSDINGPEMAIFYDPNELLFNQPAGGPATIPNPHVGEPYIETYMQRREQKDLREALRLTAAYDLNLGDVLGHHQLAFMAEHWEQKAWNTTLVEAFVENPINANTPENVQNYLLRRTYLDFEGPVENIGMADYRNTPVNGTGFIPLNTPSFNRYYLNAWMLATQSKFWRDRVVVTLGYREDSLQSKLSSSQRSTELLGGFKTGVLEAGPSSTEELSGDTLSQGVVFHLNDHVSVLANHSTNFAIPALNQTTLPRDPVAAPEGETQDIGLQLSLLEGRLAARIVYYETDVTNNSLNVGRGNIQNRINAIWDAMFDDGQLTGAERDAELVDNNAYNFDNSAQGWEVELVANPLPNWRLMANFATGKTSWTNVGTAIITYLDAHQAQWTAADLISVDENVAFLNDFTTSRYSSLEGTLLQISPEWTANMRTNYSFTDGPLQGIYAGLGARLRAGTVLGYTSEDPATRSPIRASSTVLFDANLGYRARKTADQRFAWSVQLNVKNLLDEDDLIPQTASAEGDTLSYRFQTPRQWYITTSVDF